MRQACLLFLTFVCVGGILTTWLFSAYASSDIRTLSKLAMDGPHSASKKDDRIVKVFQRTKRLSEYATNVGVSGWFVAIGSLLYALRLLRRFERIGDENATLKADLEEKKVAEQVAAPDG